METSRRVRRPHQEGGAAADPREGQAGQDPRRHPGHGQGPVGRLDRGHQEGAHRRRRGPQAEHPGRRGAGHQLRSGRGRLPGPGQRRRDPLRRAADQGRRRGRRRGPAGPLRRRHAAPRGEEPLAEWERELLGARLPRPAAARPSRLDAPSRGRPAETAAADADCGRRDRGRRRRRSLEVVAEADSAAKASRRAARPTRRTALVERRPRPSSPAHSPELPTEIEQTSRQGIPPRWRTISAADVKRLRELTGAGMMDCKRALDESDGDFDKAVELLRIKGAKDIGKRAERTTAEGLVAAARLARSSSSTARPTSSPRTPSSRSSPTGSSTRPPQPSVDGAVDAVLAAPLGTGTVADAINAAVREDRREAGAAPGRQVRRPDIGLPAQAFGRPAAGDRRAGRSTPARATRRPRRRAARPCRSRR